MKVKDCRILSTMHDPMRNGVEVHLKREDGTRFIVTVPGEDFLTMTLCQAVEKKLESLQEK